jgi:L-ascorbate metabolism protein UlaG (beta-lactamase superfamily)
MVQDETKLVPDGVALIRQQRATLRQGLMPGPLRHLGELARARARRGSAEHDDRQALDDLQRRPLELPAGLELEWLGVSGYRLTYEGRTLFIDPYLSRVPFRDLLLRRPTLPDPAALERFGEPGGEVVGVLVGHTHFDHAVDAPAIAGRHGCRAYGSGSLVNLMALHGLDDRAVDVDPYRSYELGPFVVRFTPSVHSKLLLGLAVPFDGELTCDHLDSLAPGAYRCGQVWGITIEVAGLRFYHQGSANLIDDAIRERGVDVFLAGVAGRGFTRDYWRRILPRLDPGVVVPTHYDNFFRPLGGPMEFVTDVRLAELPREIVSVSPDIELAALPRSDLQMADSATSRPGAGPGAMV